MHYNHHGLINKVVFLTVRPVSVIEEKKWCFDYLRGQNLDVVVFDLTRLLHNSNVCQLIIDAVDSPLKGEFIHQIASYQELECLIKAYFKDSLFIDYLVGVSNITLKEERVFRILKKYNAKYTFLSSGALPESSLLISNKIDRFHKLKNNLIKSILNPEKLWSYFAAKVILILMKFQVAYSLPIVIYGGDSEVLKHYVKARNIDKIKVIPIHSSDYDSSIIYLNHIGNNLPKCENICVFLDEALTHHSDFTILGVEAVNSKIYFEKMILLFDFIEKNTELRVVIAAHPRSDYASIPSAFGEREIIKGRTVDLVAKSKLVVMHDSTSLNYAIIFRKKVLMVKIPSMSLESQENLMVEAMGAEIGEKTIDLEVDKLNPCLLQFECDYEKYLYYEKRYIRTNGLDDIPAWSIVVDSLETL